MVLEQILPANIIETTTDEDNNKMAMNQKLYGIAEKLRAAVGFITEQNRHCGQEVGKQDKNYHMQNSFICFLIKDSRCNILSFISMIMFL